MRYQKRDKNFRDLINKTAETTGFNPNEVDRTVEFYFKTMAQLIEWKNTVTIHMDYIGDLIYNQKWVDRVKKAQDKRDAARQMI